MHFTREPIIETVITPKDGCKLVVRNSKGTEHEEYLVDAVEVVTFGNAYFFRSTERPKSFLVPVTDYEIFELKETRMVLKNINTEKSIKIGGGNKPKDSDHDDEKSADNKKKDRRRNRRKRVERPKPKNEANETSESNMKTEAPEKEKKSQEKVPSNEQVSTSFISKLFPPPPNLIKDKFKLEKPPEIISEESIATEIPEVEVSTKDDEPTKEEK